MNRVIPLFLCAALVACTPVLADGPVYDDRWYVAPAIGTAFYDSDRQTSSRDLYLGLGVGRFFTPNFSLDLRYDRYITDFKRAQPIPAGASDRFNLFSYGLVGRYHLPGETIRPYGLLGVGIQEHRSFLDDGRDVYGSVGLGARARVNDSIHLRFEAEARYDNDRDTLDRSSGFWDFIASVGVTVSFGEPPRAPVPAPPEPREPPPPRPAPEPEPEPEPEVLIEFDAAVTFDFDSARLRPEAVTELNEAVALLEMHEEIRRVEVAGHTCDLGPAEYNQRLSERRAQAVADYLVEQGIDRGRLVVRGFGENQPRVPNISEENRRQNRRVVVTVLERD